MNNRSISALGLNHPRYDYRTFIACFSKTDSIRFRYLQRFFGPNNNLKRVLKVNKKKVFLAHLINGSGMNNNRTCPHEITFGETHESLVKKILARDQGFLTRFRLECRDVIDALLVAPHGSVDISVSPWLEHQPMPKKAFDILAEIVRQEFGPSVVIVTSPVGFTKPVPGYEVERHGDFMNTADRLDLDGTDSETVDLVRWGRNAERKGAKEVAIWGLGCNGNGDNIHGDKPWLPPQQRTHFTTLREFRIYKCWVSDGALDVPPPPSKLDTAGLTLKPARDGDKRNFLFKLGEGKNIGVVVLPDGYKAKTVVVKKNGKIISECTSNGVLHGTNRQIWWTTKHPAELPLSCVVVIDNKIGYVLGIPFSRID